MSSISALTLKGITLLILVLFTFNNANSRELLVLSSDGPPHMIAANHSGIDIDIINNILTEMGHKVNFQFTPLKRAELQVKKKEADVFLPTFFQNDSNKIFLSKPFIQYRPMLFSLKKDNLLIEKFSDLKALRIISFQGATGYFGEEFKNVTKEAYYTELNDMSKFPQILITGRADVIVLDYYIFYYFLKKYQEQNELAGRNLFPMVNNYSSLVNTHDIISQVSAYAGFNDEVLRDDFNKKLDQFIKDKRQNDIIEKYIGTISTRIQSEVPRANFTIKTTG